MLKDQTCSRRRAKQHRQGGTSVHSVGCGRIGRQPFVNRIKIEHHVNSKLCFLLQSALAHGPVVSGPCGPRPTPSLVFQGHRQPCESLVLRMATDAAYESRGAVPPEPHAFIKSFSIP